VVLKMTEFAMKKMELLNLEIPCSHLG